MEAHANEQLVILVVSSGRGRIGAYHGLYAVSEDPQQGVNGNEAAAVLAVRVHGTGPPVLTKAMVVALFKFDTTSRELREVGTSQTFTFTTDAVGVDPSCLHAPIAAAEGR
jgi:hypothetical protein